MISFIEIDAMDDMRNSLKNGILMTYVIFLIKIRNKEHFHIIKIFNHIIYEEFASRLRLIHHKIFKFNATLNPE